MIHIKLYEFDELSQAAQEIAISEERASREKRGFDNFWCDEQKHSAEKFMEAFGLSHRVRARIDNFCDYVGCQNIKNGTKLSGVRLRTWLINNHNSLFKEPRKNVTKTGKTKRSKVFMVDTCCPFTGFCNDDDILGPMKQFIAKPDKNTTLESLLYDCLHSLDKAIEDEEEYYYSDEGIGYDLTHEYDRYYTETGQMVAIDADQFATLETV